MSAQIGAPHRVHEQEIARQGERLLHNEGSAAQCVARDVSRHERCPAERQRVALGEGVVREAPLGAVEGRARIVRVHEIGDLPARGGGARAAQVVRVHVGVDDRRRGRAEVVEQRLVRLEVPTGIDDDRVAVAHQHVR